PAEGALHDPTARQQDETLLGLGQLDDNQLNTLLGSRLLWLMAGIALVNKGNLNVLTCDLLNLVCQLSHLGAVSFIGRGQVQSQQMAQGIYRHMHLAALAPFGTIVARSCSAFRAALQRSTVEDGCRGLLFATFGEPQQFTQVMHHRFKYAC